MLDHKDTVYIRDLAKKYKEATSWDKWGDIRTLWEKKNALQKTRPLILCTLPNEAWEELVTYDDCKIKDPFIREYELFLLRQLYRAEHIQDDEILEPVVYSPIVYTFSDWFEGRRRPYSGDRFKAAEFHPVIHEYSDLKKIKKPELVDYDEKASKEYYARLQELLGDILEVKYGLPTTSDTDISIVGWGYSAVDVLCELRGMENVFLDMAVAPDFVHEAMSLLTEGIMDYKKTVAENGWLRLNNMSYVRSANTPLGSNGLSVTKELPQSDFDGTVRYKDLWGYTMAQEFSEVSPGMLAEFILPYQKKMTEDLGLLSYGCCEANDKKWDDIIQTFDNLREVSVSHVADLDIAADKIKDDYVFSWKPNCTVIATFNEDEIREQLQTGFDQTKDCHMVCCLRDNITLFGQPGRISRWVEIAQELAQEYS